MRVADRAVDSAGRGSRVRWLIWSVLALCYLIVYFQRVAPGVVADRLMAEFATGGAVVGLLSAIYFYVYAAMQIPSGLLADTLGVRWTVTGGASLAALGSVLFGMAPTLEAAYFGRFLVGLGVSVVFVATLKFQSNWFRPGEFGTVAGLLMLVGSSGAVVATTPVAWMSEWLGWRLTFVAIGLITAAAAGATALWVRDHPSELGLPSRLETGPGSPTTIGTAPEGVAFWSGAREVWRNRQTWSGFLAHFGLGGAYLTFVSLWAVPYVMHVYGADRIEASNYLLATLVGGLAAAPLTGYVSDRLGLRKPPVLATALLSCGFWLALAVWDGGQPPTWALYPLFVALGLGAGNIALILTCVKEANPPHLAGLAIGTANNGFLCAALLQPAIGYLLDGFWTGAMREGARVYPAAGYQAAMAILAAFALVGLLAVLLLKETYCRDERE